MRTLSTKSKGAFIAGLAGLLLVGLLLPANARSVAALRLLFDADVEVTTEVDECGRYVPTYVALRQRADAVSLTAADVTRATACWSESRRLLAYPIAADAAFAAGDVGEVCRLLQAVDAIRSVSTFARLAVEAADTAAADTLLQCLEQMRAEGGHVSGYLLSSLYFDYGRLLEEGGREAAAMQAYRMSFDTSPAISREPVAAYARLLEAAGRADEALQELEFAATHIGYPTGTFYLWRDAAAMYERRGDPASAACAYLNAQAVMDEVPERFLPAETRRAQELTIQSLAAYAAACAAP